MKFYKCNRFGEEVQDSTFEHGRTATVSFHGPVYLYDDTDDLHLCSRCTKAMKTWIRRGLEEEA